MSINFNIENDRELATLLERYFAGETTVAEERWLQGLAKGTESADFEITAETAEALEEALAVMSYSTAAMKPAKEKHHRGMTIARKAVSIAASVAVVAIATTGLLMLGTPQKMNAATVGDRCEAWVNGKKVEDPDYVMKLMKEELSTMNSGKTQVNDAAEFQLNEIRNAMNNIKEGGAK